MKSLPRTRLFINQPFIKGARLELTEHHVHYVLHVMRMVQDEECRVFNGNDGEWLARLVMEGKRKASLTLEKQLRSQTNEIPLTLAFPIIKPQALQSVIFKACEMGVSRLIPMITEYTDKQHVKHTKLEAYCTEACEQCERLSLPVLEPLTDLKELLVTLRDHVILWGDESLQGRSPLNILPSLASNSKFLILVGPEGGFSNEERETLRQIKYVYPLRLGPRILRVDTAVTAMLTCVQLYHGDWKRD